MTTFAAAAGATYEIAFAVTVGAGTNPVGSNTQQVQIEILSGGEQSHKIVWINATQTWEKDLEGFANRYAWNAAPVEHDGTFTAAETGQATMRHRFTLPATPDVNDDMRVRRLTITQTSRAP